MAGFEAVSFASDGDHLATTTVDGRLRIWETATGILKQEYTPSSHLSATCSCLAWGFANAGHGRKRKKRRSEVVKSASELTLLAMGTSSGTILLYSISKGDLQSQMTGGHSSKVTALCWSSQNSSIYSCAKDQQIIEWDIETGDIRRKWKADQGKTVHAMCVSEDGQTLITASRKIHWWDLRTLKVVKTFTGHATPVRQVMFASYLNGTETDSRYLLSCASGDKVINAWQLSKENDKNALVAFSLSDEPVSMDVSLPSSRDQTILLAATTKSGTLHIFEHHLNGRCKKPLQPAVTITVTTTGFEEDGGLAQILPIAGTRFCNDLQRSILFTYGSILQLRFEKLPYSSKEKEICLVRNNPSKLTTQNTSDSTKIKAPNVNSGVKVLAPSNLTVATSSAKKRQKLDAKELPMEERLNILSIQQSTSEPPRISNHAQLLLQALQSNDAETLTHVFNTVGQKVVVNTVQRLPCQSIVSVIKELQTRLHSTCNPSHKLLWWIRCLLMVHTSYLTTLPNVDDLLGPLHQYFVSRVQMFSKMSKLQGKLNLTQAQMEMCESGTDDIPKEALLVYNEESSDEAEEMTYDMPSHSETEEEWNPSSESENEGDMELDNDEHHSGLNADDSDELFDVE